jgi:magnesium and cobalt transporter
MTSLFKRLGHAFSGHNEPKNKDQLLLLLREAQKRQLLDADALSMIEGVLHISEMRVKEIMIPRAQMSVVENHTPLSNIIPTVLQSGHSRFPVLGSKKDEIIGILLAKDLLACTPEHFQIQSILRPALFVPETKRLDALLSEFRRNHQHLAVVVDEYGRVVGLVTIEDVIEQIVGDIEDEHDPENEIFIRKTGDTEYFVKALTPVEDFNQYFATEFDEATFDTVGGLVTQQFGRLPNMGESTELGGFLFTILKADNRKIQLLKLTTA